MIMDFVLLAVVWLLIGGFGFFLLDKESREEADFLRFFIFIAIIPFPFLAYLVYAFFRLVLGYSTR
jgi:hypothetical protein